CAREYGRRSWGMNRFDVW
nr:immunoglobulin heavy chain junction region [Macaca mulatta]MOY21258.1 immunoglobulin heavy chain junction region [Macaca mulatta]MOY22106.1 immunoglobulin heavy chain junction region [Macaca mulatta]MOY22534.1 immunoglobulin heavy chain junction region [Macaca mulatta]MOY22884.1 immunoglobulin heavy chain junction region [Macaca mulatta]